MANIDKMTPLQTSSLPIDAILVVSFGGPEQPADIMPFLENVLRGKNVPHERMLEVAHHYEMMGGKSPINEQNYQFIAALQQELIWSHIDLPVYWGNRNWRPMLADTMRQMRDDGIRHALVYLTSAYSSYSGCRQYREDLYRAQTEVGEGAPEVTVLRKFFNHPGFIIATTAQAQSALNQIPPERRAATHIAFTAHSIPLSMARNSKYEEQLRNTCELAAEGIGSQNWKLVYQSRSGPPRQPWLEPDIGDHLRELRAHGVEDVVIAPIGFITDHVEVLFDLDTEARNICNELGLQMARAATVGTHPRFIHMVVELIQERLDNTARRPAWGLLGPSHDICPDDCCLYS